MPDPAAPAQPAPTTPKQTAANIVNNIQQKAAGKSSKAPQEQPPADPTNKAPETPPDPNAGKEKYVVEGREVWLTPDQAKSYVQKGLAFEPKMDQLARLQQESMALQRALIDNPGRVLANLSKNHNIPMQALVDKILSDESAASDDVKEVVGKWFYQEAVEPMQMTPEQLKAREDARWRQERELRDKAASEEKVRLENQARVTKAMNELKTFIGEAMKESGLPSNDTPLGAEMARMVADSMRVAKLQGQIITPKQAIEFVKKRIKSVQSAYYDNLEAEALVQELGEKNAEKVKQYFLKLAKNNATQPPTVPKGRPAVRNGERSTITPDEMNAYLDTIKKTGSIPK